MQPVTSRGHRVALTANAAARSGLLLAGLAGAVGVRVAVGSDRVAASKIAKKLDQPKDPRYSFFLQSVAAGYHSKTPEQLKKESPKHFCPATGLPAGR